MGLSLKNNMPWLTKLVTKHFNSLSNACKPLAMHRLPKIIQAVTLASEVCMANALRPAMEMATDRAESADALTELAGKHARIGRADCATA
ncbi:MAG: hypothetical protein IPH40_12745 [Polaromonas sp.]|nr:hypothetical protein [Polaromonas sp.]